MAELDDFFKRKDKKKVKGKKFTTTEEIAKRLEETEKKVEKELKKPPTASDITKTVDDSQKSEEKPEASTNAHVVNVESSSNTTALRKEEEEWNDYQDENDKDYSDLKITRLDLANNEDGAGSADEEEDEGPDSEKKDGVWKRADAAAQASSHQEEDEEEKEDNGTSAITSSNYVPPHMRNISANQHSRGKGRRNKEAPDISNEMAFPSLSDAQASNPQGAWGRRRDLVDDRNAGFESVRGGGRLPQESAGGPRLSTANRFDALSTDAL